MTSTKKMTWGFYNKDGVIAEYPEWRAAYKDAYEHALELTQEYRCDVTFYPLSNPFDFEKVVYSEV